MPEGFDQPAPGSAGGRPGGEDRGQAQRALENIGLAVVLSDHPSPLVRASLPARWHQSAAAIARFRPARRGAALSWMTKCPFSTLTTGNRTARCRPHWVILTCFALSVYLCPFLYVPCP